MTVGEWEWVGLCVGIDNVGSDDGVKVEGGDDRGCGMDGCVETDTDGTGTVVGRAVGLGNNVGDTVGICVNVGIGVMVGTGDGLDPELELLDHKFAVIKELTTTIINKIIIHPNLRARSIIRFVLVLASRALALAWNLASSSRYRLISVSAI